jgi:hypothetical protein
MLPTSRYLDLGQEGEAETGSTTEFLTLCLLGARDEAGRPSNEGGFDEDVNVYLTGLLERFLSPAYHEEVSRFHYARDLDLARDLQETRDDRFRYQVYRVNADHLLLAIGLFAHVEGAARPHQPHLHRDPVEFVDRGGIYYKLASSSLRRLRRRTTGPELAMTKLGQRFAHYAEILRRVRTSYFHLTERLGDGQLFHLLNDGAAPERNEADLRLLYDRFLDAFSAWKRTGTEENLARLREAVTELRATDPDFAFQLPGEPSTES